MFLFLACASAKPWNYYQYAPSYYNPYVYNYDPAAFVYGNAAYPGAVPILNEDQVNKQSNQSGGGIFGSLRPLNVIASFLVSNPAFVNAISQATLNLAAQQQQQQMGETPFWDESAN